jgi:Protein of unknown function (DUF3043)
VSASGWAIARTAEFCAVRPGRLGVVFRRRSTDAPDVLDADQAPQQADNADDADYAQPARSSLTPKKAGPTPKRSEAEANRRAPYRAPADRKSAAREGKQRDRSERARRAEALQRGEEWAIPSKDRGPIRGLARDVVDSRHGLSEYYLIAALPILVLLFLHVGGFQYIADAIVILILIVVIGEGYYVGRKVERLAQERFPGKSTRGIKLYSAMRTTQMRRLRMPKPRVNRGDPV